jgi:hypothetical protein
MANIFKILFSKKEAPKVKTEKSKYDWRKSPAHLELLKKFEEQYSAEIIYQNEGRCNQ